MATRGPASRATEGPVQRNVRTVAALERQVNVERTGLDRLSDLISRFAGGPWFAVVHIVWFIAWIAVNSWISRPFDPWPFTFLTFVVSIEAIFLSSFILISQNHFEKLADRRAHLDLQINLLAEEEMTKVLQSLELIGKRIGIEDLLATVNAQDLARETDVERVAKAVRDEEK